MESWECSLLRETCPQVLAVIEMIDEHRARDLVGRGLSPMAAARYRIIDVYKRQGFWVRGKKATRPA